MSATTRRTIFATCAAAIIALGLALPAFVGAKGPVGGLVQQAQHTVNGATGALGGATSRVTGGAGASSSAPTPLSGNPPAYTPPVHGGAPHSQGTVAVGDVQPSAGAPVSGDPAGGAPLGGEEVVVGRSRGEQQANGSYHGHITILALLGQEIFGVDSAPGQSAHGPLDAIQTQVLDAICQGSGNQLCLTVLKADSSTTSNGSSNAFEAAGVHVGGANGVNADVATSNGSISQTDHCQTAHSDSGVASANVGSLTADALHSSSDSRACNNAGPSRTSGSTVANVAGYGLPVPASGCADGTPNAAFTALAPLFATVCNADDVGGSQVTPPYAVREALSAFVLQAGDTSLAKATAAAAESRAAAPPSSPGGGTPGGGGNPGPGVSPGGGSNPNDPGIVEVKGEHASGQRALAPGAAAPGADAQASGPEGGPSATSSGTDALPFTGTDLVTLALIGLSVMAAGLAAMALADRRRRVAA